MQLRGCKAKEESRGRSRMRAAASCLGYSQEDHVVVMISLILSSSEGRPGLPEVSPFEPASSKKVNGDNMTTQPQ